MQIFHNPNYNFVKWRVHAVVISLVFMAIGLVFFFIRGGMNIGIDFAGGASVVLKFRDEVPMDMLRSRLADASIQQYGKAAERSVLIRLPQQKEGDQAGKIVALLNKELNPEAAAQKFDLNFQGRDTLADLLKAEDPDRKGSTTPEAAVHYAGVAQSIMNRRTELRMFSNMAQVTSAPGVSAPVSAVLGSKAFVGKFSVLNQETVGPQVGKDLRGKAIWAVVLSILAMAIYITIRFDLSFGVGALFCIVHDVLITFAFMVMIQAEFNLVIVAAILTIIGYSVNDTVVTYDRFRELRKKLKTKELFEETLNRAINQTLSRTVLTSGSVFLVLLALVAFGGKVINDFAWILLMGVVTGTYSTLFIIPAIVIAWNKTSLGRKTAADGGRRVEMAPRAR